ncbi:MAG: hypothetical protein JXQ30_01440 [Spirochaetes bacterium]|nr:hypothetical protein [Spirochaetota bacterium]
MRKILRSIIFPASIFLFLSVHFLHAGTYYLLRDYYALLYGGYHRYEVDFLGLRPLFSAYTSSSDGNASNPLPGVLNPEIQIDTEFNFEAEIDLDLSYGTAFSLEPGVVTGAGAEGITEGLSYDLVERILLEGRVGERLFVEFNYDSTRTEAGIGEEKNIYSVKYQGEKDEFLKEATLGNKYLSIEDTRYTPIDEGNQDSFALRARAGTGRLELEGLFRYNVALDGKKQFKGFRRNIDMRVLDTDYAKGRFFLFPDRGIDEQTLRLYRTAVSRYDIVVDDKKFVLLGRGTDYDFDDADGVVTMKTALGIGEELVVYYEKDGVPVGDGALGINAMIDHDGIDPDGGRVDFNLWGFSEYFDSGGEYLYLMQTGFNSYWEMRNIYYLEELEGTSVHDVSIELQFTGGGGINGNYAGLLESYEINTTYGTIRFLFSDDSFNPGGGFYSRPFPGTQPFSSTYTPPDPTKPFDSSNPIYGGINYPLSENSVNTIHLTYSFYAESFFLDFDLVPGSVTVLVNGNTVDRSYYDVDHSFGIVTFKEGVINPASDITFIYRYTPFGGGDQDLLAALGVTYAGDRLTARNLTSFRTAIKGEEAPAVEDERKSVVKNATALSFELGATEEEEGVYARVDSEVAFSSTNKNVYGSAVVADMEGGEYTRTVPLSDSDWMVATRSQDLPDDPYLDTRGNVLYKNYWYESFLYGDQLQTLSWNIPSSQVFEYHDKAGPYNTSDHPSGGDETSLVIDYELGTDTVNPYVTVVTPLGGSNLAEYERFNFIARGDVSGATVRIFFEVLKSYDEDVNANGFLDTESSINDRGFRFTPEGGTSTVVGTDRKGNSNGRIDSEDLNKNGYLDTGTEESVTMGQSAFVKYAVSFPQGTSSWEYVSVDILDLVEQYRTVFQYANALRITVAADNDGPAFQATGSGKIVINKLWFSGAAVVNNSKQYLTVSEVTVNESLTVKNNSFSNSYPWLYNHLHGNSVYRDQHEHVEGVLRCTLSASAGDPLTSGTTASLSRRFGTAVDMTSYREYTMFLFLPSSETVPANLSFVLSFMSSTNERLDITIPGDRIVSGWNRIDVSLDHPYSVALNDAVFGTMTRTGDLSVLKRVTEIRFGFLAQGGDVTAPVEVWLDEWHTGGSREYYDKAAYAEGTVGYNGKLVSLSGFSLLADPSLSAGYEHTEGEFDEEFDYKRDRCFGGIGSTFFEYLGADLELSNEYVTPNRAEALFPSGLDANETIEQYSHSLTLDLKNGYIPVLTHGYDRRVVRAKDIELTDESYRYKQNDEYTESVTVGEKVDFPFGVSQSYSLTRSWTYEYISIGYPETGFVPDVMQDASVSQTSDMFLSYSWGKGSTAGRFRREIGFDGGYGPFSEDLYSSYAMKLGSLFDPPNALLRNTSPSYKSDDFSLDLSIPLVESVGCMVSFDTAFDETNFSENGGYRDTASVSTVYLSIPFRPLAGGPVEIVPSIERKISGDYRKVYFGTSESNILLDHYRFLFMPPFYYINPLETLGLGRVNDYEAVDLYSGSDRVLGNSTNMLTNAYELDAYLDFEQWYVPSLVGLSFGGETMREGAGYTQKRSTGLVVGKYLLLDPDGGHYDKSLDVTVDFTNERNYATKVVSNTVGVESELHLLRSGYSGFEISHRISLESERQRTDDPAMLLFPNDPSREPAVSVVPDSDTLTNEIGFAYLWELDIKRSVLYELFRGTEEMTGTMKHTEQVTLENIYTFTDREKSNSFSNIPVRVTLEHESSYGITENITFEADVKAVVGVEEKVLPPSVEGNILPSMGLEFGVKLKIVF